ncbi:MAG: HAMP domain-containing sensor histidine kinase [Byssovorax sp.]
MTSPSAKRPTAVRRASRITSRAVEGKERAPARSRTALEREQRRLTRVCAGLRERAEEAARAQGELLEILSHDLRNPLSVILMSTRMLAQPSAGRPPADSGARIEGAGPAWDPPNRRLIEALSRAAEELSNLAQDMSDAGRLEAGRLSIAMAAVDVAPLVAHAVAVMRAHAEVKHLRLNGEVEPDVPPAFGDRDRIARVLINLIANAVKFTPKNGAITVRARLVEGEVWLSVQDTGPGLTPEQREQLFTLPKSTRTRVGQGAGLSLFVARGTVEAQGGRVWAESEPGQGSTFSFALPEAEGGAEPAEAP